MANDLHTVSVPDASDPLAQSDRIIMLLKKAFANGVGSGAGAALAVPVTGLRLPASYAVFVNPSQDATHWISNRTQTGFTVNLAPRLAANTLAAGTFDLLVLA